VCRERANTLLVVSHDPAARSAADRVLDIADVNRVAA
jgi:excinuclease UvrABC ATPase subunit